MPRAYPTATARAAGVFPPANIAIASRRSRGNAAIAAAVTDANLTSEAGELSAYVSAVEASEFDQHLRAREEILMRRDLERRLRRIEIGGGPVRQD